MKKTLLFSMMAMFGLVFNASAQADLAASDTVDVSEMSGVYMINGYVKNVGDATYSGPLLLNVAFYGLNNTLKGSGQASISNSQIDPGAKAGVGFTVSKDMYPWNTFLVVNTKYYIKVSIVTSVDQNPANDAIFLMDGANKYEFNYYVTGPNSVNETVSQNALGNIYPNPVVNNAAINFSLTNNSLVSLKIYNAIGSLVQVVENKQLSSGAHTYNINVEGLEKGVYFYVLETNEGRIANRFTKQ